MSAYSVKKPFTVFVAVVAILVLGVVAYLKMTPDLMPNMNLPYVIVMTSCPGSTPEKVELSVTRPMEQSFATLDKIKSIESVSNENYSLITLEFADDVNMDTISVDILQKVDLVSGSFEETVGTPYILKINPSMLPVAVVAVGMEGMDVAELSDFVDDNILPKLEGVEGVASVDASGMVKTKVNVVIDQDKIDEVNKDIRAALDVKFADAKKEIDDGQEELDDQKRQVESGKRQLANGRNELAKQTSEAQAQIAAGTIEIANGKTEIEKQTMLLDDKKKELTDAKKSLGQVQTSIKEATDAKAALTQGIDGLKQAKAGLDQITAQETAAMAAFQPAIDAINADTTLTDEQKAAAIAAIPGYSEARAQFEAARAQINAQLSAAGVTATTLDASIAQYEGQLAQIDSSLVTIDKQLEAQGLTRDDIPKSLEEIDGGLAQIENGYGQLAAGLAKIGAASDELERGQKELDEKRTLGILQLSEMTTKLLVGESQLTLATAQLDQGLEEYEKTKKDAYKQADMKDVITMDMVSQILAAQNFAMPAGYVSEEGIDYLVNVGDKIADDEEIADLLLVDLKMDDVDPIYLKDVAEVFVTDNADEVYANINGTNGVILSFTKQSTYATATVAESIKDKLDELCDTYEGFHYATMMDQGDYIYLIINSILKSLLFGAIFAIIILFVFLKDIRPTFITLCSIPVSVIFAIVLMYFSGVTLNMISLSGLAIAVGMLVDNSVVVIENTFRLIGKGETAIKAAVAGATQVAGAIAASTLTTICVFLPIVFVEGITRQIFTDLALTITYSLLASLVIALTLVPAMAQGLLRNVEEKNGRFLDKLLDIYEKLLCKALQFKPITLLIAVVLLVLSAVLILARGYIFMPAMSGNQITATVQVGDEDTLADLRLATDSIIEDIRQMDNVVDVGALASTGNSASMLTSGGGSGKGPSADLYIMLTENKKLDTVKIAEDITALGDKYNCTVEASGDMMGSFSELIGGSGIKIHVYGSDLDTLQKTASGVADIVKSVSGTAEVSDGMEEAEKSIKVTVDKEKAMAEGLTVAQVFQEINAKLTEEKTATNITMDGTEYDVTVLKDEEDSVSPEELRRMKLKVKTRDGEEKEIRLTSIAEITESESLNAIRRRDQKRYIDVTSEIAEGHNVTLVTDAVIEELSEHQMPTGTSIEFEGANESIMKSMKDLVLMILLGIVLVYLVMVAQFQSLRSPFIVIFTIPLAFTGGFLGLLVTGMEISVVSMMGFVMLTGIIVNNGIVLVDFINQLRADGWEKTEALIEAGKTRMRPILMTTLTTILGLIVMALGTQMGSEMMQPVAIVCIGGLSYATLMTLFVVPVLYDLLNRKDIRVVRDEDIAFTEGEA